MSDLKELTEVQMKNGLYSLTRIRDGMGDSGSRLVSLIPPEGGAVYYQDLIIAGPNGFIKKGCWLECGSITARSYSVQDFWFCTPIKEFLEIKKDADNEIIYVRFSSQNSEYEVKSF